MTSNIGILYTVGKHFLPRVWIRDHYLKIRFRLARIYYQSLSFFVQKCRLSSGMEGTSLTSRLRWTCWDLEMTVKVARRRRRNVVSLQLIHAPPKQPTTASHVSRRYPQMGRRPMNRFHRRMHVVVPPVVQIATWCAYREREKKA